MIMGITVILGALPIHGESEIYDSVVRLHVLANSDSEEDQSLKLKVPLSSTNPSFLRYLE